MNVGILETIQTLAETLKETEPGPSFSNWCMITFLSFQKSLSITSQPQKTPELRKNGSMIHL